jgi:hypothetical protein
MGLSKDFSKQNDLVNRLQKDLDDVTKAAAVAEGIYWLF